MFDHVWSFLIRVSVNHVWCYVRCMFWSFTWSTSIPDHVWLCTVILHRFRHVWQCFATLDSLRCAPLSPQRRLPRHQNPRLGRLWQIRRRNPLWNRTTHFSKPKNQPRIKRPRRLSRPMLLWVKRTTAVSKAGVAVVLCPLLHVRSLLKNVAHTVDRVPKHGQT